MLHGMLKQIFFAMAVFATLYIKSRYLKNDRLFQDKAFSIIMLVSMFTTIADIVSSTVMNGITNWWLYQISMIVYALSVPIMVLMCVIYSLKMIFPNQKIWDKRSMILLCFPYLAYTFICLSNPITSWMFSLTKGMVYTRGPLFFITTAAPLWVQMTNPGWLIIYANYAVVFVILHLKKKEGKRCMRQSSGRVNLNQYFCLE